MKTRLKRCLTLAGDEFSPFVNDVDTWCRLVIDARDDYAHQLNPFADDSVDMLLIDSLYWLFLICILKEAGIDPRATRSLTTNRHCGWLSERVHALTAPVGEGQPIETT